MGLPPNLRNEKGDSLLMLASYHGHADTVRVLMEHGADPELANDRGQTPLAGAAFKGDMATIMALLDGGADVNGRSDGGKTPLMIAAMFNRSEIVDVLLERGADPQARDAGGLNAGQLAGAMGAVGHGGAAFAGLSPVVGGLGGHEQTIAHRARHIGRPDAQQAQGKDPVLRAGVEKVASVLRLSRELPGDAPRTECPGTPYLPAQILESVDHKAALSPPSCR